MKIISPLAFAIVVLIAPGVQAENLNRKFGPSWNCSYMSVSLASLYAECKKCEARSMQFDDVKGCVSRDSLRQSDPPPETNQERREREMGKASLDKEERELSRQQIKRRFLDSDVSGFE